MPTTACAKAFRGVELGEFGPFMGADEARAGVRATSAFRSLSFLLEATEKSFRDLFLEIHAPHNILLMPLIPSFALPFAQLARCAAGMRALCIPPQAISRLRMG
jgi:hypothetical protein